MKDTERLRLKERARQEFLTPEERMRALATSYRWQLCRMQCAAGGTGKRESTRRRLMDSSGQQMLAGRTITGAASARITIDGREYLNFFGSGYLALSNLPELREAVGCALTAGTAFSRQLPSVLGALEPTFEQIESAVVEYCGSESSVYLPSGYLIGMAVFASLEHSFDLCVLDELAHYALQAAARVSGLPIFTFTHRDPGALELVLKRSVRARQRPLIMTDGVFPTTGGVAPLHDFAQVVASFDGRFLIDDSHGFGVVGELGRGTAEYCGVEPLAVSGATLSKAFCAQGAIVPCSKRARERLLMSPVVRGACAGSPLSAVAATAALRYVSRHPERRRKLAELTKHLRTGLRTMGFEVIDSPAPIVAFQAGSRADMLALQRRLFERGIHLYYSTYLGAGAEGVIRCAVFADHSIADLNDLLAALR